MLKFLLVSIEESTDGLMSFMRGTQIFHKEKGRGFIRAEADTYHDIQKIAKKHPGGLFVQNALTEFVPLEAQPSILII